MDCGRVHSEQCSELPTLRNNLTSVKVPKKLLALNYGMKLITVILTIFIISSNIAAIFEGYKFYKQRPFFEEHAGYYYTNLGYKATMNSDGTSDSNITKDAIVNETFYRKFFETFDATTLVNITQSQEDDTIFSIKKILGYSTMEKNKKILLMTIISTAISIGAITNVEEVYYIAVGGAFILILEASVIFSYIRKIEESSIQKILKGGSL